MNDYFIHLPFSSFFPRPASHHVTDHGENVDTYPILMTPMIFFDTETGLQVKKWDTHYLQLG